MWIHVTVLFQLSNDHDRAHNYEEAQTSEFDLANLPNTIKCKKFLLEI